MADIETLADPEAPENAAYAYQRADGTIEYAVDAEDAIARCDALSDLAKQNPEQVNALLELAAIGQDVPTTANKENIQAENKTEPPSKPREEEKTRRNEEVLQPLQTRAEADTGAQLELSLVEGETVSIEHGPETIAVLTDATPEVPEPVQTLLQNSLIRQTREEIGIQDIGDEAPEPPLWLEAEEIGGDLPDERVELSQIDAQVQEATAERYDTETETPNEREGSARSKAASKSESADVSADDRETRNGAGQPAAREIELVETRPRLVEAVIHEEIASDLRVEVPDNTLAEAAPAVEAVAGAENEADSAEHLLLPETFGGGGIEIPLEAREAGEPIELYLDPEIIETHRQLLSIVAIDAGESAFRPDFTEQEASAENPDESMPPGNETIDLDFESLVAEQVQIETPAFLEIIREHSNEQPLEQTLAQLAEYASRTDEVPAQEALAKILPKLEAILPPGRITAEETEAKEDQPEAHITPEMTEKLLVLLKALGYERPGEVLVTFVRKHKLESLLQALEYIVRLNGDKEHLPLSPGAATDEDEEDGIRAYLSRIIFALAGYSREFATV